MSPVKKILHQAIDSLNDEEANQILVIFSQLRLSNPEMQTQNAGKTEEEISQETTAAERAAKWDKVFANKLHMGKLPYALDLSEISSDEVLF